MDVLGYIRVSTAKQGADGLGADAQRAAINAEAERRGWTVVDWYVDEASGKSLDRPGIQTALERLENGGPKVLVAAKLDRIARSAIDFLGLVKRAEARGWALILLEPNVDMTEPMGRFTAGILAQVAELERDMIGQRTRDGMAQAKARGARIGQPRAIQPDVRERIHRERATGASLRAIAAGLTADGVPTARGGSTWSHGTVQAVLAADA